MASPAFATFHEWELCPCEEWNCDCHSGTDPRGKYNLGRDINNRSIWPSLTFDDFWMMMPKHHRATFENWRRPRFEYLERLEDRKTRMSAVLSSMDGRTGHILLRALQQAPETRFEDRFTLFTMCFKCSLPRRPEDLEFWSSTCKESSKEYLSPHYKDEKRANGSYLEFGRHEPHHAIGPSLLGFPVYGEKGLKGDHHFRPVTYDPPDSELSDRMSRLPQEPLDQIYLTMLDATIGRREALLEHQSLYPHVLRALSRADYQRYKQAWISEVTWVLSPRTRIHSNLRYEVRELVVRLDQSFRCRTYIEELETYFEPRSYPMWKDDSRVVPMNMFDVAWEYTRKANSTQTNMVTAWRRALEATTNFDLQLLTLDFTDTYGLYGCWAGLQVIKHWRLTRFRAKQIIIKAPEKDKEELIWHELEYGIL